MSRDTMFHSSQNVGNQISNVRHVKVHAPPGGATSFSLAWGAEPAPAQRSGVRRDVNPYAPGAMPPAQEAPYMPAAAAPVKENYPAPSNYAPSSAAYGALAYSAAPSNYVPTKDTGLGRVSSNAYATGANQNAGNVLTDRRTTKVAAPPGGRTSIVLG